MSFQHSYFFNQIINIHTSYQYDIQNAKDIHTAKDSTVFTTFRGFEEGIKERPASDMKCGQIKNVLKPVQQFTRQKDAISLCLEI